MENEDSCDTDPPPPLHPPTLPNTVSWVFEVEIYVHALMAVDSPIHHFFYASSSREQQQQRSATFIFIYESG